MISCIHIYMYIYIHDIYIYLRVCSNLINAIWWVQIEAIRSDLNEYMSIHGRMDGSQKWIWRSPDEFWCKLQPIYPSLNGSKAQRRWTWINVIATTIRLDCHLYEVISGCWPWAAQRREKFWQLLIPKCGNGLWDLNWCPKFQHVSTDHC